MSSWRNRIGELFQAHQRHLEALIRRRVGNRDVAADLVQDVFARALASGPRATTEEDERVLFASARNAAIEHYRSERRRGHILDALLPEQLVASVPSTEGGVQARQTLRALDKALAALSPRCREIFILRRVDGLSNKEIAQRHGISVNSVEKHIARALRHCQDYLADHLGDR